jgi:hypothetical protein
LQIIEEGLSHRIRPFSKPWGRNKVILNPYAKSILAQEIKGGGARGPLMVLLDVSSRFYQKLSAIYLTIEQQKVRKSSEKASQEAER